MAWIESHQQLGRHPKLIRFSTALRIHKAQAIGHLQYLWWWTLDYSPAGDLSAFAPAEVSAAAEWPGEPGPFYDALMECKWMDPDGRLHDWDDYAGRLVAEREKDRLRKKAERDRQKSSDGHPPDGGQTAGVPNPTQPNSTQPNSTNGKAASLALAESVYSEYPLKVGKPRALAAIQKALRKHPAEFLIERTKAFTAARGGDVSFCPHPSTWFNQERFNDDPATWLRPEQSSPPVGSAQLIVWQKELESAEKRIASILNNYAGHQSMSQDDRQKLKPLRARRDELKNLLGVQV